MDMGFVIFQVHLEKLADQTERKALNVHGANIGELEHWPQLLVDGEVHMCAHRYY